MGNFKLQAGYNIFRFTLLKMLSIIFPEETAKDVYRVLSQGELGRDPDQPSPTHRFLATGDAAPFARLGRRFLGPEMGTVTTLADRTTACS